MRILKSSWMQAPAHLASGKRVAAIGDVHGMTAHLTALRSALLADLATHDGPADLVYLGDYLDRGPDPLGSLDAVAAGGGHPRVRETALMGNHEAWLLDLLDRDLGSQPAGQTTADPTATDWKIADWEVADWLDAGGETTRRAADAQLDDHLTPDVFMTRVARGLGTARLDWLRDRPLIHRVGPYVCVHAGLHPKRPLDEQDARHLLWIRDPFIDLPPDLWGHPGLVALHGHTPRRCEVRPHRIGVDADAVATGVLAAVNLIENRVRFVVAAGPGHDPDAIPGGAR